MSAPSSRQTVSCYDEVCLVMSDPGYTVPEAPAATHGLAWLRGAVCRFANGATHERRRALIERDLADIDPLELRIEARRQTVEILARHGGRVEIMHEVAQPVPVRVLCSGLGVAPPHIEQVTADVLAVAARYISGGADPDVDACIERLRVELVRDTDEASAAAIAIPVQAAATAGLIGNAIVAAGNTAQCDTESVIAHTLRYAAPVRPVQRPGLQDGVIDVDLAIATRTGDVAQDVLTFGVGIRPCPGRAHAVAIAAGALDALLPRISRVVEIAYNDAEPPVAPSSLNVALDT